MSHHVVVDGSNLATEGRAQPSLHQLNEAVLAFMAENPDALVTVVVDATFGHRIDPKEVPAFDEGISNNELVAPPAGAIGRGDAFVLGIADKVKATVISNDSYQEFHGQYPWLFDEGRLVGGKPVPHIGWVFVNRLPVRGPLSRKSVADGKRKSADGAGRGKSAEGRARIGSPEASLPMPVPKGPPPQRVKQPDDAADSGASKTSGGRGKRGSKSPAKSGVEGSVAAAAASAGSPVNDLLSFLTFIEAHPVGTSVNAIVDHYSSHGAYVRIDSVIGYVPLRLMADPAPRSAREFMTVGESVTLVVDRFQPAKRSIDLATPGLGSAVAAVAEPKKRSSRASKSTGKAAAKTATNEPAKKPAKKAAKKPAKKAAKKPAKKAASKVTKKSAQSAAKPATPKAAETSTAHVGDKRSAKKSGGALAKLGLRRRRPAE